MNQHVNMKAHPTWLAREERQHDRLPVAITIDIDEPGRTQAVMLTDLSPAGCRLQVSERLSLGRFVTVHLNDSVSAGGWVAWSRGQDAGVDFAAPLDDALVTETLGRGA